ncbi:hypothetical protein FHW58_003201 [Duganella sp. 1224]|uniref:hypothetical protein n=1 Tax=Duganella sp. 1224 TaxID=2587052 RepID=UPI0015C7F33E|nr:hypothetical protein [Duganella sp. 1224]NYE61994.1 hypothetical protein [Duganella sp. 1224]
MSKTPVGAASATYRKAVNGIAEVLEIEPSHSRYPSLDFEAALEAIPDAIKEQAIEWYIRGIKRGMAKATDLMAEGIIYVHDDGAVRAPAKMEVKVRTKMRGEEWNRHSVNVKATEIGFE